MPFVTGWQHALNTFVFQAVDVWIISHIIFINFLKKIKKIKRLHQSSSLVSFSVTFITLLGRKSDASQKINVQKHDRYIVFKKSQISVIDSRNKDHSTRHYIHKRYTVHSLQSIYTHGTQNKISLLEK